MNFKKLIVERFSVRNYLNKKVEEEKLLQILEAGRMAPSAVNFQPWHFIVIQNEENLKRVHTIYKRDWIREAPILLIVCADHSESWKRKADGKDSADIDVAIAVDHMTLQATNLGLGTCWVCNFDVQKCIELFKLPAHIEPTGILPIGYPAKATPVKIRKSLDEIVHWETF